MVVVVVAVVVAVVAALTVVANIDVYTENMHFFSCRSPAAELFSRALGCGASKGAVRTIRRMSRSRPSFVAIALSIQSR